ncbi:MAG TPA: TRAP transporter substrate-binding protein, partial [Stellaceae bacterium]|nr:TRAP transporter substrate-binding protein [Stellaceae bacterium]
MPKRGIAVAVAGLIAIAAGAARADEITLTLATLDPPPTPLNTQELHPWADRVNAAGKGVVQIVVRDGTEIANQQNIYDRVLSDVVQIGRGTQSFIGGKFPLSEVVALPFVIDNGETASVAFWRLYRSGLLDSEYNDTMPLFFGILPPQALHLTKAPNAIDDLGGLRVAVATKNGAEIVSRLGGAPQSIQLIDLYPALQRGAADGVMINWPAFPPFKLNEVTRYHIEAPFGGSATMIFMAKKKWDALPRAAQKVLAENSGEAESRRFGAFWDTASDQGRAMVAAMGTQQTIVDLTPAQSAALKSKIAPMAAEWTKATPGGAKVLQALRADL